MLFFVFWPLPEKLLDCPKKKYFARLWGAGWWRGSVGERRSLAGELSLSCARPAADG